MAERLVDADELLNGFGLLRASGVISGATFSCIKNEVNLAQTIDAVRVVHGEWEDNDLHFENGRVMQRVMCSECGINVDRALPYYPFCGANMDGERKDGATK